MTSDFENFLPIMAMVFLLGMLAGSVFLRLIAHRDSNAERLHAQLEDAIGALDEGFVLFDRRDRMVVCNKPFREQFGDLGQEFRPGESFAKMTLRLARSGLVPGIAGREHEFVEKLVRKRRSEMGVSKTFQTADGRWIRQRDKRTAAGNVVGTRTDVTELKVNETKLEEALMAATAGEAAKTQFLTVMSHEVRTPMNGVLGMADLLAETELTSAQEELVQSVRQSGAALMDILNDVLDLARIDSGRMEMTPVEFDPREMVETVRARAASAADTKGLWLRVEAAKDLPQSAIGDPGWVKRVLRNLVDNAIKFTETGGVTIHCAAEPCGDDHRLTLAVVDTGKGIPSAVQDQIFNRFEQATEGTTRSFGGTGLGLSISRHLARRMLGDVEVASVEGEGSRFTFSLVLQNAPRKTDTPQAAPIAATAELAGRRILVAEDNHTNRLLIGKMLKPSGAEISFAEDGNAAVAAFLQDRPDLILMDLSMPVKGGVEATIEIRGLEKEDASKAVPIVALTANAFAEDRNRCMEAGMDAFLSKPVRKAKLLASLQQVLAASDDRDRCRLETVA